MRFPPKYAALVLAASITNSVASPDSVVTFNEIHYNTGDVADDTEWIELHNQMAVRIDLSAWELTGGVNYTFPENTIIEPGAFVLVAQTPGQLAGSMGPFAGSLNNGGETLRLRGRHGRLMDEVSYGDEGKWPVGADGSGSTLSKKHPEAASLPPESWRTSVQAGGTPGAHNFPFGGEDVQIEAIAPGANWRYNATGSDPGIAWRETAFDESSWANGASGFASALVQNPSFEAETFTTNPGYISNNSAITAWSPSTGAEGFIGVNSPGGITPFSNNGLVPDGSNVAFIRGGPRSLQQNITGFVPGDRHIVRYRENGRAPTSPLAEVKLGGTVVSAGHTVTNTENSGQHTQPYYHTVSDVFTATATSHLLEISNLADIGQSLLFDDVSVDTVILHDTFSIGSAINGRLAEYRPGNDSWMSSDPPNTLIQSGVVEKSGSGDATIALPISPSANTTLTLSGRLNPGDGATTKWSGIGFSESTGTQSLNNAGVLWVLLQENGTVILEANETGGTGVLGVSSPGSAPLYPFHPDDLNNVSLIWDRTNNTATVILNGITVFNAVPLDSNAGGADGIFAPEIHSVAAGFTTSGPALDDFVFSEQGRPATSLPFQSTTTATYFRTEFDFNNAPSQSTLLLSLTVSDGAVIWLNGQELHRMNMPAGAIAAATPAMSAGSLSDTFVLHGTALTNGINVLAVEVHPAVGRTGIRFDGSLTIAAPAVPAIILPTLTLNEIQPGGFVEIKNTGSDSVSLDGMTLQTAGVVDALFSLPSMTLLPGAVVSYDAAQLGFQSVDEDRLFLKTANGSVIDAARVKNRLRARRNREWQYPNAATPGAENSFTVSGDVVINEIMYHHRPSYGPVHQDDPSEWIELYNRGAAAVDLSGWKLRDGISYDFPANTMIASDAYLVVSGFSGTLNNNTDRIELRDAGDNTVDEVEYHDGGRWPGLADGNGASLELIDPDADNGVAESWAASDESGVAVWQSYSYSGQGNEPAGNNNPIFFNEFLLGMLDGGEVLIDDISVKENGSMELIQNGDFESDTIGQQPDKWRILGTHLESQVVSDPDGGGGKVLSLRATGSLEHSYNLASTTFANNRATNNNASYQISFRARWVSGSPQLNTRLYFNRLARTHNLPQPAIHGTPGTHNSRALANAGPVIDQFAHSPLVPSPTDSVRVQAKLQDSRGVANAILYYRDAAGQQTWSSTPMSSDGQGSYLGVIPPQADRTVVEFWMTAEDGEGASSYFPPDKANSSAFYRVGDGSVGERAVQTMRIIMDPDAATFMHTAHHTPSNFRHTATVIYNDREIYYGCGIRLRGSAYGRRGGRVGWNLKFPADHLFRGVHGTIAIDGGYSIPNGQGNGFAAVGAGVATNELVYNQMAHRAGAVPSTFDDIGYIDAPLDSDDKLAQLKMARFGDIFLESEIGSDQGNRFKFELVYHPQGTLDGNPESLKNVYNAVRGVDIREMGTDKEAYRHNYWVQNHADRDDYSRIADMGRAMDASGANLKTETDAVLDIDNWMRVLAYQALTGTADTYNNGLAHNLLFYVRPDEERKVMIFPWDVDHAFYYSPTQSMYGQASHRANNVLNIPQNNRLYCGHLLHLCNTGFNPAYIAQWVSHYNQVADLPAAQHFTQWITDRRNSVLSQLNSEHPPVSFQITTNSGNNFSVAAPAVTLRGDGWIDVRAIVLGRTGETLDAVWVDSNSWEVSVPLLAGANSIELTAIDHDGNPVGSDTITVTNTGSIEPAADTNLVISEIMYHPADPTQVEIDAGFADADHFEFIELQNIGANTVDLGGAKFTNGLTIALSGSLAPGASTLLVRNQTAFEMRHAAGLPITGEYGDPADPGGDGGPKLSNSGERIRLEDTGGNTIRDFTYNDNSPWPSAADGDGYSLTLISPFSNPDHALASSWRASAMPGGTPNSSDATTIAEWLSDNGLTDPSADPDGDGLTNFATYALGFDLAGAGALPVAEVDSASRLVVTVHQRSGADALVFTPEISTNLNLWNEDPGDESLIEFLGASQMPDGTRRLQYRSTATPASETRLYLRVRMSE